MELPVTIFKVLMLLTNLTKSSSDSMDVLDNPLPVLLQNLKCQNDLLDHLNTTTNAGNNPKPHPHYN